MSWCQSYKLIQDGGKNIVEICLNPSDTEFSTEFFSDLRENVLKLDDEIKDLINEKFADIKVDTVKLLLGAMVVGSIPFMHSATAAAADIASSSTQQVTQTAQVQTTVQPPATGQTSQQPTASVQTTAQNPATGQTPQQPTAPIQTTVQNPATDQASQQSTTPEQTAVQTQATVTDQAAQKAPVPSYSVSPLNTTGTVTSGMLNMRLGPSVSYAAMHQLYYGNKVHVIGKSDNWYQIQLSDGRTGFVSMTYLRLEAPTVQQQTDLTITIAKSFLGTPYVWGGSSPQNGGFDCSGFTQYVYGQVGYNLNRISRDQALQGSSVSYDALNPGDLVFFSLAGDGKISHVGIYIGSGQMIHSPKTGDFVRITNITTWFWQSHFIAGRRIIGVLHS